MKSIQDDTVVMRLMDGFANATKRTGRSNRNTKQHLSKPLWGGVLLAAAVFLACSSSRATLVTYEGFNYPPTGPAPIDEYSGGCGWNANWGQFLSTVTSYSVTNGSLASGSLYAYSNSVFSTGGYAGRYFTAPGNWAAQGTTNYFSILIRPTVTPATNHFYGLQIYSNCANTGSGYDLLVGKNGNGLNWGLEYAENPSSCNPATNTVYVDSYSGVPVVANQTVLLVARVIFSQGSPDSWNLYVNPTAGNPEPATPDATIMVDIGTQAGIQLDDGNGGQAIFDEIRIGATFASVTPTTATTCTSDPNLVAWEPFAYTQSVSSATLQGEPTDGTQASNGWDNVTWNQFLGSLATNFTFLAGSLSDPSGKLVTSGNSVHAVTTTNQAFAGRFNAYTGSGSYTNPTYFSILIRPDNLGRTNIGTSGAAYFQIFGQPSGNDLYAGYLFGSATWGLQNLSTQVLSSVAVVSNQTTLLVVRGNYVPSGLNTFLLYVNPTPGAPEPASPNATYTFTTASTPPQNGVAMQVWNGAAATFDEIRVGTNFADVTPAISMATTNPFVITSIQVLNGTNPVVSFLSTSNVVYSEDQKTNLVTDAWSTIASNIPGTGGIITITNAVPPGAPMRFYRVRHQ